MLKIVAISDVHDCWGRLKIPDCDILISAGDYSFHGEPTIIERFHKWLNQQPAKHIISVQGNHETWVEKNFEKAKEIATTACSKVHFMDEGLVEVENKKIWCSAITPWFHNWAWNRERGPDIKKHWDKIPLDTDILVTHGPPYGVLDIVHYANGAPKERVGCYELMDKIKEVKPDVHIFGHIHSSHGQEHRDGTSFYNVSICDEIYCVTNPVTVIEI